MRVSFFLPIFLLLVQPAVAQYERFSLSAKAGFNAAYIEYLDKTANQIIKPIRKAKPGLYAGINAAVHLNPALSVEADLLYSQKGLRYVQEGVKSGRNVMDYVELPISGHFRSSRVREQFWDAFAGAYVAYWVRGAYIVNHKITGIKSLEPIDFKSENHSYNRTDIGFFAGLSYITEERNFIFDIKYAHGFGNIASKAVDPTAHRVISFGLKYIFIKSGRL